MTCGVTTAATMVTLVMYVLFRQADEHAIIFFQECNGGSRPFDFPKEPSAFGAFNILSGPFADMESSRDSRPRKQREWEREGQFDDGYGFSGSLLNGAGARLTVFRKGRWRLALFASPTLRETAAPSSCSTSCPEIFTT